MPSHRTRKWCSLRCFSLYRRVNNPSAHFVAAHSVALLPPPTLVSLSPLSLPNRPPTEVVDQSKAMEQPPTEAVKSLVVSDPQMPQSSNPNPTHQLTPEQRFQIVRSVGEECIQEDELLNLLTKKPEPVCYDGFEPSGRMHIAQEGGKVEFLWSSKEINAKADEYWPLVLDIAQKNNLKRIIRCSQIMGRSEHEELTAAQIFYPCMQCADIFFLKADICQLGMDQRKVNVLAREYCDDIKRKNKPIILSHHML
ncbi:Tyrosine--tRNA ligase 1 [Spatholobus suberectus]|nr:Tyrosine--tRNA ligase 1 [Spatholobus suberectus]